MRALTPQGQRRAVPACAWGVARGGGCRGSGQGGAPEAAGGRAVRRAGGEEVALPRKWAVIALALEGLPAQQKEAIGQAGREALGHRQGLARAPDHDLGQRVLGGEQDRFGDDHRLVDRRDRRRTDAEPRRCLVEQWRVDRRGQDGGRRDPRPLVLELQSQRVHEPHDAELRGAVRSLERDGAPTQNRGDRDDPAFALPPQVRQHRLDPVHLPEQVDLDDLPDLLDRQVLDEPVGGHRRAVDPRVDPPERLHGALGQRLHLSPLGHIGRDGQRLAAEPLHVACGPLELLRTARGEHHARSPPPQLQRGLEPDPRRRAGDHDNLLGDWSRHPFRPQKAALAPPMECSSP